MNRLVYRIVRRLRAPGAPLSRNRHYATFSAPEGRRALRIHRQLESLEADLLDDARPRSVSVERCAESGAVRVQIDLPDVRASRTTWLSREEFDLLLDSPRLGPLLRDAGVRRGLA